MADIIARSFFCVLNNPAARGYEGSPSEVCIKLRDEWTVSDSRSGAWAYCVSADGLHHVHMVLCDSSTVRYSSVVGHYAVGTHFEITRGSKKDVEAYINKTGKFAEKGEKVLFVCRSGEILANDINSKNIFQLVKSGYSDYDIISANPALISHLEDIARARQIIEKHDMQLRESLEVHYIFGAPGTGKSRFVIEKYGISSIYRHTDYKRGYFDGYDGQDVIVFEEFRSGISISLMLEYLDIYPFFLPARYRDKKAKYTKVYIISNINLSEQYPIIRKTQPRSFTALLRRISDVMYFYEDGSSFVYPLSKNSNYRIFTESELLTNKNGIQQGIPDVVIDSDLLDQCELLSEVQEVAPY